MPRRVAFVFVIVISSIAGYAADWPLFRGADRSGVATEAKPPLNWGTEKNVKWKVALPSPGNSSPIVAGNCVFLTCAQNIKGTQRSLYCFNRKDGKELWVRTVSYDQAEPAHETNPYCASSPAADGQRVVVWHGSAGLHCYDYEGKLLWSKDLGAFRHIWGYASSPIFYGNSIILNCGPGARQSVIAMNAKTGQTLWQTDEPGGSDDKSTETKSWRGSWSTPLVVKVDGTDRLLVAMPGHVNAYDPKTGKIIWHCDGTGDLSYTDPLISGNVGVYMSGFTGPAIGFKLGGTGDVTQTNRLWRMAEKIPQRIGSGVIVGQHIFMANEPGFFQCLELATGKEVWRERVAGQNFWGSITAVGDRLYVMSKQGSVFVFAADPMKFRLLARNEIGESSNSTMAIVDGQIFMRTAEHLYCIE